MSHFLLIDSVRIGLLFHTNIYLFFGFPKNRVAEIKNGVAEIKNRVAEIKNFFQKSILIPTQKVGLLPLFQSARVLWYNTPMNMLTLTPEIGVPYEKSIPFVDLRDRAMAVCETAKDLSAYGLDLSTTEEDNEIAAILAHAYAKDPEGTSRKVTDNRASTLTPASLVLAGSILNEFGQLVVQSSMQIRHMVTNKLILEAENPDARVRLRALELLGKISDVGLFTDKKEVTVTHSSTQELRATLKNKLARMLEESAETAEYEPID